MVSFCCDEPLTLASLTDGLPGCRRDLLLTQTAAACEFNVMRWIEWSDARAIADAPVAMRKRFAGEGFDPTAFFMQKLGARADMGLCRES